jgi:hypothetical protein
MSLRDKKRLKGEHYEIVKVSIHTLLEGVKQLVVL